MLCDHPEVDVNIHASFKSLCLIFLMCPWSLQAFKRAKATRFLGQHSRLFSFKAPGSALGSIRRDSQEKGNPWPNHRLLIWVHFPFTYKSCSGAWASVSAYNTQAMVEFTGGLGPSLGTTMSLILIIVYLFWNRDRWKDQTWENKTLQL